jgi:putative ABC transport system ATP-binding protein
MSTTRRRLASESWGALETLRHGLRASPELRRGAGLTVALAVGGSAGRLVTPILIQQTIDRGLTDGVHVDTVSRLCLIGAVVLVLANVCQRMAVVRLARGAEQALYGLRVRLFAHIHALPIAQHAEERRGALVARVTSDIDTLSQFFAWGGIAYLLDGTLMVAVGITMLVYNWVLALVAFVVSFPLYIVLRLIQRRLIAVYGEVRELTADTYTAVSEVVMGGPVIRAYDATEHTTARAEVVVEETRVASVRAGTLAAFLFPSGEVFSVLAIAAILIIGVLRGPASGLSTGDLVGFVFLTYRFLEPVAEFTELVDQTQTAVAGWRRVLGTLDLPLEIIDPPDGEVLPHEPPRIVAEHVTYHYRSRTGRADEHTPAALRDVSFTIEPATSVSVVGATGSGKTTLAKLLTRLADPTDGRVLVGGIDLRDITFASLRSTLVMVPQEPFLFNTTIAENVRFGRPDASDAEVRLAFTELGLDAWLDSLSEGLLTAVGERGEHLSSGERQLVALARAYVANPACLILDEATSSVDPATEARLGRALDSLARGRTAVTIAHRLSTATRADMVLVFEQGRLVEQGTHGELVSRGGVYAGLYASWLDATTTSPAAAD